MTRKISWLHLSDIHIRESESYNQDIVLSALLEDIDRCRKEYSVAFDLVFITGDIAFSGQKSEYHRARVLIAELADICEITTDRVFCVPGNHDVNRAHIGSAPANLSSRDVVTQVLEGGKELRAILKRQENYFSFVQSEFGWAKRSRDAVSITVNENINDVPISILLLNSAWTAGGEQDHGRIVIGERQVRDALKEVNDPTILIALMHHPVSYLTEFDAQDVQALLNSRCDFVLHGHIHDFGAVGLKSPDSQVFYLAAGATYQGRKELLSYNFAILDLTAGTSKVFLRRYSDRQGGFWGADTLMYESAPKGVIEFPLQERITKRARRPKVAEVKELLEKLTPRSANIGILETSEPIPNVPDPPAALVEEISERRCILFAGSGASVDAQLPTWPELVRDLVEQAIKTGAVNNDMQHELEELILYKEYLPVAEFCREKIGLGSFSKYMRERLSHVNRTSQTHRLLSNIPFLAAITTNYDRFIESSRGDVDVILPERMEGMGDTYALDSSLGFPVIKISGSLEDPRSIILTQSDFRNLSFSSPNYLSFIRKLLSSYTLLFYGSGFVDPNVNFLLQQVFTVSKGMSNPHYAIIAEQGPIKCEYWYRNYNIRVIPYRLWNGSHIIDHHVREAAVG